jgi:hypothetical protein
VRPGGHLATTAALSAASYAVTGSAELAAGCFVGGFLIDLDHYLDYLTVEGQWRRPSPSEFLHCYFGHRYRRLVLPLHSLELMSTLAVLAVAWPQAALLGYILGALLHLALDVLVNGQQILLRPLLFYSLAYRARLGFARERLIARLEIPFRPGDDLAREFLTWRPPERRLDGVHAGLTGVIQRRSA